MKRLGNLFDVAFSRENLYLAYLDARKKKRKKRSCFNFECALGANLNALYQEIRSGTYRPRPYYRFVVHEPKERIIHAPAFRDCVVQHATYRVIYPIFDRTFISTSFACRPGYGTHKASDFVQRSLRECSGSQYVLKLDVRRFFYRIDRGILRHLVERKIKDRKVVDMMMLFAEYDEPLGIPIGNLLSQLYALIYLNPLDHFIKRDLKIRRYVRYVDDLVMIGLGRGECLECRRKAEEFLRNKLHLELSKSTIQKVKRGVNFVGYRTWRKGRFIRKHSLYKFRRAVRDNGLEVVASLLGHAKQTRSLRHMLDTVKETSYALYNQIPGSYRRLHYLEPHGAKLRE